MKVGDLCLTCNENDANAADFRRNMFSAMQIPKEFMTLGPRKHTAEMNTPCVLLSRRREGMWVVMVEGKVTMRHEEDIVQQGAFDAYLESR